MSKKIWDSKYIYLFLLPAFVPLIIFGYYPAVEAFTLSFTDGLGNFVGLDNFIRIGNDEILLNSIGNMVFLLIFSMLAANIPALITSELLFNLKNQKLCSFYRYLFTIPMLVPGAVVILLWQNVIFDPGTGLANAILAAFNLEPLGWLGEIDTALISLAMIGFPWIAGTNLLIYLAGLQNIPESIIDAVKIDGGNLLTRFLESICLF